MTIDLTTIDLDVNEQATKGRDHFGSWSDATVRQLSFIERLREERDDTGMGPTPDNLSKTQASKAIDWLLNRPFRDDRGGTRMPQSERPELLSEGIWVQDGDFYKVIRAVHGSGRLYVKEMGIDGRWHRNRATPTVFRLARSTPKPHRLTDTEASVFGKFYGICLICGRTLTDEDSIERGIGPVCAAKQGW